MHSIPLELSENNSFCAKAQRRRNMSDPKGKTPFLAFPEAKKAICRSQLQAQTSQMHSIPLGTSEKNSFSAKAQRRRDMCDP